MINPNWNEGIAQLLPNDYQAADYAYRELLKRWPQINRQTTVQYVSHYRHQIALVEPFSPPPITRWKQVAISGWERLRNQLFFGPSLKRLDDPVTRAHYHRDLLRAIWRSPQYLFWRIAGRLFRRADWRKRGMETAQDWDAVPATSPVHSRMIELEPFAVQWREFNHPHEFYIVCGYEPLRDVFLVKR